MVSGFKVSELGLVTLTHRLHSSSFLGLPYRILYMNPKKELLWSLWVGLKLVWASGFNSHRLWGLGCGLYQRSQEN